MSTKKSNCPKINCIRIVHLVDFPNLLRYGGLRTIPLLVDGACICSGLGLEIASARFIFYLYFQLFFFVRILLFFVISTCFNASGVHSHELENFVDSTYFYSFTHAKWECGLFSVKYREIYMLI